MQDDGIRWRALCPFSAIAQNDFHRIIINLLMSRLSPLCYNNVRLIYNKWLRAMLLFTPHSSWKLDLQLICFKRERQLFFRCRDSTEHDMLQTRTRWAAKLKAIVVVPLHVVPFHWRIPIFQIDMQYVNITSSRLVMFMIIALHIMFYLSIIQKFESSHFFKSKNRESTEGYSRWKVEKRQGRIRKTGLNDWSISKSQKGTEIGVRNGTRPLSACQTSKIILITMVIMIYSAPLSPNNYNWRCGLVVVV